MAKRNVYLHVGPVVPGVVDPHAALRASPALAAAGLAAPKVDQEVMDRADTEIRRRHKELGLKRKHVEGCWAEVCRRAFRKARKGYDVVISQPRFLDADYQQVALALDGLVGLRLHLVLTPGDLPPTTSLATSLAGGLADDPAARAGHWARFVRKQGRVHVLDLGPGTGPEDFAAAMARLLAGDARRPAEGPRAA